jgi:hypothetical protein
MGLGGGGKGERGGVFKSITLLLILWDCVNFFSLSKGVPLVATYQYTVCQARFTQHNECSTDNEKPKQHVTDSD